MNNFSPGEIPIGPIAKQQHASFERYLVLLPALANTICSLQALLRRVSLASGGARDHVQAWA